jgi:hypothetical protein
VETTRQKALPISAQEALVPKRLPGVPCLPSFFWSAIIVIAFGTSNALAYDIHLYESEPNDHASEANTLPYYWTIKRGNIKSLEDTDWFALDIEQASSIVVDLDHPEDGYQYNLFVVSAYDEAGQLLSQVTSYAPDGGRHFEVGLSRGGRYYLVVETACDSDGGRCEYNRSDEYELTVSVFDADVYIRETEPNNTMTSASDYSNGGIATGQISSSDDEDYFVITTESPADVITKLSYPQDSYQYNLFSIQVLDRAGLVLNETSAYAPDGEAILGFSAPEAGRYYLKVTGCQSDGGRCEFRRSDQYTLQTLISAVTPSAPTGAETPPETSISMQLDIHAARASYTTLSGEQLLWFDLKFQGVDDGGTFIWSLDDFGVLEP